MCSSQCIVELHNDEKSTLQHNYCYYFNIRALSNEEIYNVSDKEISSGTLEELELCGWDIGYSRVANQNVVVCPECVKDNQKGFGRALYDVERKHLRGN